MSQMKTRRNDLCTCGSGKKYKLCCMAGGAAAAAGDPLAAALELHRAGQFAPAAALYRRVLDQEPAHPDALHMLGLVSYQTGNLGHAAECVARALALAPGAAMYNTLGLILGAQGERGRALDCFQQALQLDPDNAAAHSNLGTLLQAQGKLGAAIDSYLRALALDPTHAFAYCNLGSALAEQGNLNEAIECYQKALALDPRYAMAHNNLGNALRASGRSGAALEHLQQALALDPHYAMAYNNLGNVLRDQGRPEAAIEQYRQALARDPQLAEVHSNLLLTMHTVSGLTAQQLYAEHLRFGQQFEAPLRPHWQPHANGRDPQRRLKVGYVSGDFRDHPLVHFVEPVLAAHDKSQVEVFCYYNHAEQDASTRRIAALADHWLACRGMSDDQLAARIRDDGIDVLIDLSGHTAFNRLLVFARKPAPVQMTWVGYQSTTGLQAMDYRLTDPGLDPEGMTERFHTETLLRMSAAAPFRPAADSPPVNQLPALTSGVFTLACLNQLTKVSAQAIGLWSRILHGLPNGRLMLANVNDAATRQRLLDSFAQHGIGAGRLLLLPRMAFHDYLALHGEIDLALDSFPYNGGTTTLHSLSMGVPAIALAGDTPVSRAGAAIMTGIGLADFVAHSHDEYVQRALEVAADPARLNQLRQTLRQALAPLADGDQGALARQFEALLRAAWIRWCAREPAKRPRPA